MLSEEKPELRESQFEMVERKRWKASKDIEDKALSALQGVLPTRLRASTHRLEEFYQRGYLLYQFGRYQEAQPYFHMLVLADAENAKYLTALAACYHMLKDYVSAIQLYTTCMFFEPDNPLPLYHTADCYTKIFEPVGALIALEMAVEKCKDPKHKLLKDRMQLMINRLNKELKEKMAQSSESFFDKRGKKVLLVNGKIVRK
jgi:type III secretion system low calcium response chaperone LcrH/SycD